MRNKSEILIYQAENGQTKIDVKVEDETVWLTQEQMALLFNKSRSTINEHINNIYAEKELKKSTSIKKFGISELSTKPTYFYNLDVIISVGYRVKSLRGTQFRIWATQRLKEYIIKGFALDDERLKQGDRRARYFEELLQRIRDIRSSERNFYQKVTDIYATSIDYKKDAKITREFFATVQNKIHFAVHGKTAAEVVFNRADAKKPLMGLTSFKGNYLTAEDATIAKNYLIEPELKQLNLIVSLYLDFAELQASNQIPMKMKDWIKKLNEFLAAAGKKLLKDKGSISHNKALARAEKEFEKYKNSQSKSYISDFDKVVKRISRKK